MERYLTGRSRGGHCRQTRVRSAVLEEAVETYVDSLLARLRPGPFPFPHPARLRQRRHLSGARRWLSAGLGADVTVINDSPDGFNINDDCGSTHMEQLQADGHEPTVTTSGLAFDGDGDRVLAVDASGELVDGDFIMAICANYLKEQGKLPQDTIVTTVMTNLGFHIAMNELGIDVKTTAVGDRYVLEEMLAGGYRFRRRAVRAI